VKFHWWWSSTLDKRGLAQREEPFLLGSGFFFVGGFPLEAKAGSGYEGGLFLGDGV